ncbi:MAG TPA: histidine kinase [Gaiellaceae bacterium]|nr:histidine kinase [Gaiellaceae bacterium]
MPIRVKRLAASAWADAALAAALLALAQVELWSGATYDGGPVFPGSRLLNALLVIPLFTLPLALRRRAPLAAYAIVVAAIAVCSLALGAAEATSFFLVALIAVYSAAANGVPRFLVLGPALAAIGIHELRDPHVHGVGDVVWAFGFAVLAWLFGLAVRGRQRRISSLELETLQLQAARDERARAAVAEERARIARELHDIVAHAVSVVVVQAQAGQRLVGVDDDGARASLGAIEESARGALSEMRRLLGLLRSVDGATLEPSPGIADLGRLVEQVREAGLDVAVEVVGEPSRLAPGVELTVYRVVQEGLTNALKHSGAATARVTIRHAPDGVRVEVADDGGGASASAGPGGHGLIGIRERIELYGGSLESGRRAPGGGWVLEARLPLEA